MHDERELLRGNTHTLVLAVLRQGPLHGYAIAKEVTRRSGNALGCKQGTLYPILITLEQEGFIHGAWEQPEGQRPKKVYELTRTGGEELDRRVRSWREFNAAVERVLGGGDLDVQQA